jgi:integrase
MLLGDASADYGFPDPTARIRTMPNHDIEPRRLALSADELRRLLEGARQMDPEQYPLLLTLALTGARWGEATALKWSDIDETEGTLRVVRSHVRGRVGTTKTGKTRVYPLVPELIDVLREHRQRLLADQHPGLKEGWVFATTDREGKEARLACPKAWARALPRWLRAAGITKHITPHSLRRTNVDLLRRAQVDAVVARSLVGHATEAMRDHYSTVASDEQHEAVNRVVKLVKGGS